MKALKIFVAALLLVFVGSAYAENVEIINLEPGDVVSADGFNIIGKVSGYDPGSELLVVIEVCSHAEPSCEDAFLDCESILLTGRISIQNQVMKRICPVKRGNIMIIGKSGDYLLDDQLDIRLKIWNPIKAEWIVDEVYVYTE